MAELVGLIASITGIAAAGAKLSVQLFDLTSQVGSARQDVAAVGQEISVFAAVLGHIATTLETPSVVRFSEEAVRTASWITSRAEAIFKELEEVINAIEPAAGTTQENKSTSMSFSKRVKWLFKRQRVVQLRASLESMKLTLQLMLTTVEISGKMQSRRNSVASAATAVQVADREIAVAESLVIAHQLSVERLRTIEENAENENTEDTDTPNSSTQPSATFSIDPARSSRSTGWTSALTTETHADEVIHNGKGKDTPRDSTVLAEAASVHDVGDSARRSMESLSSVASITTALLAGKWTQSNDLSSVTAPKPLPGQASDTFPARTATPGASNQKPSKYPRVSTKDFFPQATERWETLSAHWEGMTSFWIRKLQENTEELDRNPVSSQLSRQVTDLSVAGTNLFNAVGELQRLRASSERKFQRWFLETRTELERNQEVIQMLETKIEETRSSLSEEITRERELADEALQSRVQKQRDLDREISRFTEERKIRARLQDDLQRALGRLALERKSKQDLQAALEQEKSRHKLGLSNAAASLEAEKKNKEALQAELDQEKERRRRAIQFLTGETGESETGRASPAIRVSSAPSVSSAGTDLSQRPITPSSPASLSP